MRAIPADSGLYQVLAIPELSELPRFRQNLEESYLEYVRRCDPVAHALSDARRVGKSLKCLREIFPADSGCRLRRWLKAWKVRLRRRYLANDRIELQLAHQIGG